MFDKAIVRDFSGGWDVADEDINLSSKFQPIADNITSDIDNSLRPRYGYQLEIDFSNGIEVFNILRGTGSDPSFSFSFTSGSPLVSFTLAGQSTDIKTLFIALNSVITEVAGIPISEFLGYHDIRRDGDTFYFRTRSNATSTTTVASSNFLMDAYVDYQGDIIDLAYIQGKVVAFKQTGVIISYDPVTKDFEVIWSQTNAYALPDNPMGWGRINYVSFDTYQQTLICCNGRRNDKPIEISFNRSSGEIVQYLTDPADGSNAFVPKADFVLAASSYVLLLATDNVSTTNDKTTYVDVSAANTSGVFVGNANPDDATQFDAGRVSASSDPTISGAAVLRDRVVITFFDTSVLGTLGAYTGNIHKPDFKDQIIQHGSINHRVIKSLGNDLLMTDLFGVPQFTQAIQSGVYVPDRISYLIAPVLTKHLSNLEEATLRFGVFAVFNQKENEYMLFVPKFDSKSAITLPNNPITVLSEFDGQNYFMLEYPQHRFDIGDRLTISGATDISGNSAAAFNQTCSVVNIINENFVFVSSDTTMTASTSLNSGGDAVVCTPISDETIGYILSYNPSLKIKRWKRYRNLNFTAGVAIKEGKIFFSNGNKLYIFGTSQNSIYVDRAKDYDYGYWEKTRTYAVGEIVRIQTPPTGEEVASPYQYTKSWKSYIALVETNPYVSGGDPETFDDYNTIYPTHWEEYTGDNINWVAETPWSDMGKREILKKNKKVIVDAAGTDQFTLEVFTDKVYNDPTQIEFTRAPQTSRQFTGQAGSGYGTSNPSYGGGFRTREQLGFSFPFKGILAKLRFSGSTRSKLKISGITLLYQKGSIYR